MGNNITHATHYNNSIGAILHTLETWFASGYVIVNTSIEVNNNNNKNSNTITIITVKHDCRLFRHVRKIAKGDYSTCVPVHPSAWINSATAGCIFMTFEIQVLLFETLSRKFKFH